MHLTFSPARLRALREDAGWKRPVLARRAGLSVSTIRDYEHGYHAPSAAALGRLAVALHCSIDELFVHADAPQAVSRVA